MAMTIGEILDRLRRFGADKEVEFEFCNCTPGRINSYRGYYDQPALGWEDRGRVGDSVTVQQLIEELEVGLTDTFEGWKGGDYRYHASQLLWIANRGCTCRTMISDIAFDDDCVILMTERVPW